jgi:predicted RNA binding protein YcfA (HicA-like mRNA interferase family)
MRLPRDLSWEDLVKALARLGYTVTRQTGSHLRLTTQREGEHHVTVPRHQSLRVGTLSAILNDVAAHVGMSRQELLEHLFGSER